MSLNIDFTEKDEELCNLLEVAEAYTLQVLGGVSADLLAGDTGASAIFEQAVILHARHAFETGGTMVSGSMRENPQGYWALVNSIFIPG